MRRLGIATLLLALVAAAPLLAVDRYWTGRISANWSEPANWEPAGVPASADALQFPGWPLNRAINFDLPPGSAVGPMSFLGDYSISGNLMTLTGDIGFTSSPEAVPVTLNADMRLGNAVRFWGPFSLVVNGGIDVNGQTLRMGTTYATLLKGPLTGSGTFIVDPRGVSLLGGGNFSGNVEGNAWVAGSYPNATFHSPWLTGSGAAGATIAKLLSPGEWQPWLYLEPHTIATLHTGALAITSQLSMDLVPGGASDRVAVNGSVSLAGRLALTLVGDAAPGSSFVLIDNDGTDPVTGTFTGLPEGAMVTAGSATFVITYRGGDGNDVVLNAPGGVPPTAATTTTLTQNRATSEQHQPVTFTATVIAATGTPAGTVSFFDGAQLLGSEPLVNGTASLTVKTLEIGVHEIKAVYDGSAGFDGTTSPTLVHTVVKGNPNATLTSSSAGALFGDPLSFAVAVRGNLPDAPTPGGSVTLSVDGAAAGSATLAADGTATIAVPLMPAGVHSVTALYSGDAAYESASVALTQTVAKAPTGISVHSMANPSAVGVPVTMEIQVSPIEHPAMPVGGNVVVTTGGQTVSEAQLIGNGAAASVGALAGGDYTITATYTGDANFQPASTTVIQHVAHPAILIPALSFAEGDSAHEVLVRVRLTEVTAAPVTVDYRTVDGTATAGADYAETHGTLLFDAGQTEATIVVRLLGDTNVEPEETFAIDLTNARGATVPLDRATVVIANDDISYRPPVHHTIATSDGVSLPAAFYAPVTSNGPWPVIVWVPGDRAYDGLGGDVAALRETARGYAVVSVTYRSAANAPFPAQVFDLMAAVRWLRANAATLNVDPNRIVAWGAGTGGHLAALLGTGLGALDAESRVQAVVDWNGIADVTSLQSDSLGCGTTDWNAAGSPASQLIGCALQACPESANAAAPARYARAGAAPLLLMHGSADCLVAPRQSERLYDAWKSAGADATLRIIPFTGHDDAYWTSAAAFAEVDAFLDAKLQGTRGKGRAVRH
jgi:acetyl esterase/lipase